MFYVSGIHFQTNPNNVEGMLDLADRFIMPMVWLTLNHYTINKTDCYQLTRKCEVFLSKKNSHGINDIRIIEMADRFNLIRTRMVSSCSISEQI